MTSRPKILIVINYYLPGFRAGGPVRTIANMVHWMGDEFCFQILTGDRDLGEAVPYPDIQSGTWQPVGKAQVRYLSSSEQSLRSLGRLLNQTACDLLYLDGAFAPLTLKALLLRKLALLPSKPIILVPRGHLHRSALDIKPIKKRLFLHGARLFRLYQGIYWQPATDVEREYIRQKLKPREDAIWVLPDFPTPITIQAAQPAPKSAKRPGSLKMVFLSRIAQVKNLDFVIDLLQDTVGQIQFDIYGPLEDADYWQACQSRIAKLPDHVSAQYHGEVAPDQVLHILSHYHLFVLPTRGENFGHVILEALCASCPVLISDQTLWSGVNESGAGWAYPINELMRFKNVIRDMLAMDNEQFQILAARAHAFGESYINNPMLVDQMRRFFYQVIQSG